MRENFYGLWYENPAVSWVEALPLGNGRMGVSLEGGIQSEIITINEDTVWDGGRIERTNPEAYESLQKIREAIFREDYECAEKYGRGMLGNPLTLDSYQPLSELEIRSWHTGIFENYRRSLDLKCGITEVEYNLVNCGHYHRTAFISAVDDIFVMNWETDDVSGFDLDITFRRKKPIMVQASENELLMTGECREGGVKFAALLQIRTKGGICYGENGSLKVRGAGHVEMRIATATDFRHSNVVKACRKILNAVQECGYENLQQAHVENYSELFGRQYFSLECSSKEATETESQLYGGIPATDKLLEAFRRGEKKSALYVLFYDYLRYLMISSSRPGTMPSNLQGIWNNNMAAPWNSDFHPNVNMEINYWAAEGYNLPECVEPLTDWLEALVPGGTETAAKMYHAQGWVLHHISDIFGCTAPMDGLWGLWPFGGSWMCRHLYEHYLYTGDRDFLVRKVLPLMEGTVRFMLDFLMECPENKAGAGYLITCPSHSPENCFRDQNGKSVWLTYGATMDTELIWDLFTIYLDAVEAAGDSSDSRLCERIKEARSRLLPIKISERTGCIQEWVEDFEEVEPGHRHVSHLFALYPGNQITERDTELFEACRKTLERRLSHNYDGQGWSYGWIANLYARLKDGDKALEMLNRIGEKLLLNNLMIQAHGHPQVGDAQAFAAAIQEMLIQSHAGYIELFPALPKEWSSGMIKGLKVRGGAVFNLYWEDGVAVRAEMRTERSGEFLIRTTLECIMEADGNGETIRKDDSGMLQITAEAGKTYILQ